MTRDDILAALWYGRDPFVNPPAELRPLDLQGWRSQHAFLDDAVREWRPSVVVEIGAWKGARPFTWPGRWPNTRSRVR